MKIDIDRILKLPANERLEILEQIVKSLRQDESNEETQNWHINLLQERLEMYKGSITEGKSWEEVKRNFLRG